MTDRKPPPDQNERTIIQPNPGGRRPLPPRPVATPMAMPPAQPAAPANPAGTVDWAGSYEPVPQPSMPAPQPRQQPGQAMILKRDVPVAPNENILVEAAGPILLLLGRLRASLMHARFADLMDQVAAAIEAFEKQVRAEGVSAETARDATYALAATADDIVQNIPSEDRPIWTQYSMLSRFFGERVGGVRFFELLDKAKADPLGNFDLLELMYVCLSVGFQGIHRTASGGAAALQSTQRNLYEILRRVRARSTLDLSPHWQGQDIPAPQARFRVPLWSIAALAAVVLAGAYIAFRLLLGGASDSVAGEVRRLIPTERVALARRAPVAPPPPPPPSSQINCLKTALAEEIEAGRITAVETPSSVILRVGAFASFASGKAEVLESFRPVALRMGTILDKHKGQIRVIGHSDNTPIASARFPSNWHLSMARAQAVAALIRPGLAEQARLTVEGKGADQPLDPADTAEARARNRRVELIIPRDDAFQTCP